jgi:TolA-binding protein
VDNKMKNILNFVSIITLLSTTAWAEVNTSLESKIKAIDDQIRKEEQQHSHNAKKLQDLVSEYNKLVQEHASSTEKKAETTNNVEQTHEEAMVQRLKEHERRIDELEKIVSTLVANKGIETTTSVGLQPVDRTNTQSAAAGTTSITTTPAGPIEKHAAANLATEQAEVGPTPTLDTKSPALAQFNQAMTLFNAGVKTGSKTDLKNAAEAFELITATYPDETYANKSFVHGGDAHLKLGNIDAAQKCYKVAITKPLDRQNAIRARLGYGETLIAKNNKEDACSQIKVLSKETLDEEQKKRFDALKITASCEAYQAKAG